MKYPKIRHDVDVSWEQDEEGYYIVEDAIGAFGFDGDSASLAPYLDGQTDPFALGEELGIPEEDVKQILEALSREGIVRRHRLGWNKSLFSLSYWLCGDVSTRCRRWAQGFSRALLLLILPSILLLGFAFVRVIQCSYIYFPSRFVWLGFLIGFAWHEFSHYAVGVSQGRQPVEWGISALPPEAYVLFQPMNKSPLEDCWLYLAGSAGNLVLAAFLFLMADLPMPVDLWMVHGWKARAAGIGNIILAVANTLIGGRFCDGGQAFSALMGVKDFGGAVEEGIKREGAAFRRRNFPACLLYWALSAFKWLFFTIAYICFWEAGL